MEVKIHTSLKEIGRETWALVESMDFPFTDWDFLEALEVSGSLGTRTGWIPTYVTVWQNSELQGLTFLYLKNNSYGEYIFDWSWAAAYEQAGRPYYPKLVSAVPFTPATGPKLLVKPGVPAKPVRRALMAAARELASRSGAHSLHWLFLTPEEIPSFESADFLIRHSYQYHWHNRGYRDFDDFLSQLRRKRRHEIRRERDRVRREPLQIEILTGESLKPEHARLMYRFYLSTLQKRGAIPYLTSAFFDRVFSTMRDRIVLILAWNSQESCVAGALNFRKGRHLYGRYWGCLEEWRNLHFELCYYRTLEYAIAEKLDLFEAGAQGEHKFQRGLLPTLTYSAHWIENPDFRDAIRSFIEQEKLLIASSLAFEREHSPYREGSSAAPDA